MYFFYKTEKNEQLYNSKYNSLKYIRSNKIYEYNVLKKQIC